MNGKISIIVPVYNVERYLEECVNSIMEQTYSNWELLLLDDGSTDKSGDICDVLSKKDKRIKAFHHQNMKMGRTRNRGLGLCSGEYIMFLDSDDWLDNQTLEKCMKIVQEKEADIVSFNFVREYKNGSIQGNCVVPEHKVVKIDNALQQKRFGIGLSEDVCTTGGLAWGKLISSEIIKKNNISFLDVQPCEDVLFSFVLYEHSKKHYFINECFYHYRARLEIRKRGNLKNYLVDLDKYFSFMQNYIEVYNKGKDYWERYYLSCQKLFILWGIRNIYNIANRNYRKAGNILKDYIEKEPYSTALRLNRLNGLTKKEKIVWWLLSHKLYVPVVMVTSVIVKPYKNELIPFM